MAMQMMMLGSQSSNIITAQASVVNEVTTNRTATGYIRFSTNGEQIESVSGNDYIIGYWVTPATSANNWEIRATLDSGNTPIGTLGTWQDFSVVRQWGFVRTTPGVSSCTMTFEFRKVGGSVAEYTISGNSISVEVGSPF